MWSCDMTCDVIWCVMWCDVMCNVLPSLAWPPASSRWCVTWWPAASRTSTRRCRGARLSCVLLLLSPVQSCTGSVLHLVGPALILVIFFSCNCSLPHLFSCSVLILLHRSVLRPKSVLSYTYSYLSLFCPASGFVDLLVRSTSFCCIV